MTTDTDAKLDERYRKEGWGVITDIALGVAPSDVESQAREVARWCYENMVRAPGLERLG